MGEGNAPLEKTVAAAQPEPLLHRQLQQLYQVALLARNPLERQLPTYVDSRQLAVLVLLADPNPDPVLALQQLAHLAAPLSHGPAPIVPPPASDGDL
ncbi:MAG: hypothetical protein DRJ56_05370 [Thermoprotei archaeon]|nr:MAG: hypothetical protein DRJ56_05370 [Thermoprotei archaeon]